MQREKVSPPQRCCAGVRPDFLGAMTSSFTAMTGGCTRTRNSSRMLLEGSSRLKTPLADLMAALLVPVVLVLPLFVRAMVESSATESYHRVHIFRFPMHPCALEAC